MRKQACVIALMAILLGTTLLACGRKLPGASVTPVPAASTIVPQTVTPTRVVDEFHGFFRFENLDQEDGLSQSSVNTILQDQQGFMWFGTQDGLNRYDGYEFKVFRPDLNDPNSLSDRWITKLFQDHAGFIWIGTRLGGLNKLDLLTNTFTQFKHNPADPKSISSNYITDILEDASGDLWIGTETGLDKFSPAGGTFTNYQHFLTNVGEPNSQTSVEVNALYQDGAGVIWLGTDNGLESFDPANPLFRTYPQEPGKNRIQGSDAVLSIAPAADGGMWVGTNGGLAHFDPIKKQFIQYLTTAEIMGEMTYSGILAVYDDQAGTVWVGSENGLISLNAQTRKTDIFRNSPAIPSSLAGNIILSIFKDSGGILWVGTFGEGIAKHDPGWDKFSYFRNDPGDHTSLSSSMVLSIFVEPSRVAWIGTDGGGLNRFDPVTETFTHFTHTTANPNSLNSNVVWSVYRDHLGTLWVGTEAGLDQLDEMTGRFIHRFHNSLDPDSIAGNMVVAIGEDREGALWIGTQAGLDRFDRSSNKFIHYYANNDSDGVTHDQVVTFFEDANANFWVGTFNKGLYRLDWKTNQYTFYQNDPHNPGSLSSNSIMKITRDSAGNIWIATAGGGLNKYLPATNSFKVYTEKDGLPNSVVYSAVQDGAGDLWLSTNFGLSRFDPKSETFRNFTASDGLQSNEFNMGAFASGQDGALYFGGINGLNVFFPDQILDNSFIPPVVMTSVTQDNQPIHPPYVPGSTRAITIKWPKNLFEFTLAALSYAEPANNQFAYMLENFDKDWINTGTEHTGRYTNLPGGTYTLKVKATNNDGIWSPAVATMNITVIPPFWQTWWFRIGMAGLLALSVIGGFQIRTKGIQRRNQQLEKLVQERTREIEVLFEKTRDLAVIEERNRLARELHDSAKQKAFAALAQLGTAASTVSHDLPEGKGHIQEAENLVYEVIQELTFLIQEMYPLAIKEKGLANALREYVFEWENLNGIGCNIRISEEIRLPINIEQALYRIVQESLANIARHSRATQVDLSVDYRESDVNLTISDNGCGFDPVTRSTGIGLRLIKERAESVGGHVTIESKIDCGTSVIVCVPYPPEKE
jgi:ligand-binding sensor domain-containing protein/signal transduction histidine kinase